MMGWGSSFDKPKEQAWNKLKDWVKQSETHVVEYTGPNLISEINHVRLDVDLAKPGTDQTVYHEFKNKTPTHDPYTNPDAHIYYECACGAILDPKTKSFAALNNCASNKGWKIRFGERGYTPYCVKCGEDIE